MSMNTQATQRASGWLPTFSQACQAVCLVCFPVFVCLWLESVRM